MYPTVKLQHISIHYCWFTVDVCTSCTFKTSRHLQETPVHGRQQLQQQVIVGSMSDPNSLLNVNRGATPSAKNQ